MHKYTILDLRNKLINNEISVQELQQSSLSHLKSVNNILNAANIIVDNLNVNEFDKSKILSGIPMVLKDNICTKGIITSNSSTFLNDFIPPYSATVYERLLANNANLIAKTNLDEYGMGGYNINNITGMAKNPYDTSKSAGGSSGGSAALVASGVVPYAFGTDTGDSVRMPAALCGIYGYKPTWGTISRYGVLAYASSLDQVGVFARCTADLAIATQVVSGPDKLDDSTHIRQQVKLFDNLNSDIKPLRICYIKEIIDSYDNSEIIKTFENSVTLLEKLGHEVKSINVDRDLIVSTRGVYYTIANCEAVSNHGSFTGVAFGFSKREDGLYESIRKTRQEGFNILTKSRYAIGAKALHHETKEEYYNKAKKVRRVVKNKFDEIFKNYDVIISPAFNDGMKNPYEDELRDHLDPADLIGNNNMIIVNIIGAPGLTIPISYTSDNKPNSLALMGKPFDDQVILNLSLQIEKRLLTNDYKNLTSFYNCYVKEVF